MTKRRTKTDKANEIDWPVAIVENLVDAVVVICREGIIRYANPAAHRLAGRESALKPGRSAADVLVFQDPEDHTTLELPTLESFGQRRRGKRSVVLTHVLFTPKGAPQRIVNAVFTPLRENRQRAAGLIVRFRDVTQSVEEERELREKQKIEAISTMAASIASEFTNWLGLISGHASAIMDNLIPRTRGYEEAVHILDATKRASGLTKRLLSVARASEGTKGARTEAVDLDAVLRSAVNEARTLFPSDIDIKIKQHGHLPLVLADATQLFDCLINLLRNAVDAMPEGGTVTVDFPSSARALPHRDFVLIRIRDTGQGMDRSVLGRAFDPFFTTHGPTHSIGLGLTVVKTSVEQWGGLVKIRSRPGHGTSVRVFLPTAGAEADKHRRHGDRPVGTILVVDDQKEPLNEICATLTAAGYKTHPTHNAKEFLDFYRRHTDEIDIVIVDVVMPHQDGKYVLNRLLDVNPQANVILTSGFSRDYVRHYLKRGAWGFVQKPIDREHLILSVERIINAGEPS